MVLAGSRPLIRAELMEAIGERGVRIDLSSQAPAHLLRHAAFTGLICRGPEAAGDEPTYVLLDEWVPPAPPLERDEALALFARRYLEGHGPASAADFATWSGLPMPDARAAFALIGDECVEFDAAGTPMVALASTDLDPPPSPPRLLGRFDGYLLGYRGRDLILDPRHSRGILEGGMIQAAVVVGGRIVGTWRLEQRGRMHELVVHPFTALPRGSRGGLREEAADIGRFLGIEVALVVRDS